MNPENNVWFAGDFTDPASAQPFRYSGTTLNNPGEVTNHRRNSRTRVRGRSRSRSRSHSPPRTPNRRHRSRSRSHSSSTWKGNKENIDHPMDEDYSEPPSPPEDVPNDAYFNPRRGHSHPHRLFNNNNGPHRHRHYPPPPPPPHPVDGPAPPTGAHPPPPPPPGHGHAGPGNGPSRSHHHPHHAGGPFTPGDWPLFFGGRRGPRSGPWGRHPRGGCGPRGRGGRGGGGQRHGGPAAAWAGMFQPWVDTLAQAHGGQGQSFDMAGFAKAMAEQFPFLGGLDVDGDGDENGAGEGKGKERDVEKEQENMEEDFEPLADVYEGPVAWIVHVSLPGAKKEDIDLEWAEKAGELKIQGVLTRKIDENGDSFGKLVLGERDVGLFRKVVSLGTQASGTVDADGISAKMEDGVLAIRVPKKIEEEEFEVVRKVDVA